MCRMLAEWKEQSKEENKSKYFLFSVEITNLTDAAGCWIPLAIIAVSLLQPTNIPEVWGVSMRFSGFLMVFFSFAKFY